MGKIENMKNWMKEHKKEIAIGGIFIATSCIGFIIASKIGIDKKKVTEAVKSVTDKEYWTKLELTDGLTGMVDEISGPTESKWKDLWLGVIPLKDLGKLGEELMKIEGYSEDSIITGGVTALLHNVEELEN